MKISFKKIAKSLTGFSTPIFGISWNPSESDCEIVRKLMTFFEDRRVLYSAYNIFPERAIESILEIRKKLTNTLEKIDENSDIAPHLRAMRAACRKFMDENERLQEFQDYNYRRKASLDLGEMRATFGKASLDLGEMRATFGIHIAQLCVKYGIDIESDLASILPIENDKK